MLVDQQGVPLNNATSEGAEIYRTLLDQFSSYHPDTPQTVETVLKANPEFAMPYFVKTYSCLASTEPSLQPIAQETIDTLRASVKESSLNDYEKGHLAAVATWSKGDLRKAARILDDLGIACPRDYLCLRVGHKIDYITGDTRNLRDRPARQLLSWSDDDHHVGYIYGTYAFGLEENGRYEEAEEWGRRALEKDPCDVWALHAVTHTFEMRGMIGEGIDFMNKRKADWGFNNLLRGHIWWHFALLHLDRMDHEGALAVYDEFLFNDEFMKNCLTLVDATALLWRLYLDGHDVSDRFSELASAWIDLLPDSPVHAFNEIHALMAQVGAGRYEEARRMLDRSVTYVEQSGGQCDNRANYRRVALPICHAMLAFGEGNYEKSVEHLVAIRPHANEIGGSAAQRDLIDRTMLAAALRAKQTSTALALVSERVTIKPSNPHNWSRAADALRIAGRDKEALEAEERVKMQVRATSPPNS